MSEPGKTINKQAQGIQSAGSVLDLGGLSGLAETDARSRLAQEGPNELPTQKRRGLLAVAFGVVREPMFLMLVAAGIIYLLMGEPADGLMLIGFVVVVMAITIVQEQRTERALDALRDLLSPRALVIRDGVQRRIAGRARWCGAISSSSVKATAFPPTERFAVGSISPRMSRC